VSLENQNKLLIIGLFYQKFWFANKTRRGLGSNMSFRQKEEKGRPGRKVPGRFHVFLQKSPQPKYLLK
jgi:hypothetical protein